MFSVIADKYKYYPALKKEIDEYIKKQPLNMQINPEVIANCYKVSSRLRTWIRLFRIMIRKKGSST
jgi:hypothetical protein